MFGGTVVYMLRFYFAICSKAVGKINVQHNLPFLNMPFYYWSGSIALEKFENHKCQTRVKATSLFLFLIAIVNVLRIVFVLQLIQLLKTMSIQALKKEKKINCGVTMF